MGSLLKPFVALAFAVNHTTFPTFECRGARSGCWFPPGHGAQQIDAALANSCNAYFLALTRQVSRAGLDAVSLQYGLTAPDRMAEAGQIIGLGSGWPQFPTAVMRAFGLMLRDARNPKTAQILQGMRQCSRLGTARAIGFPCYAKTGTAVCSHDAGGQGDGFACAMYPPEQVRRVLLITRHNKTGAAVASEMKAVAAQVG
jgi:cell division protein FtsI/penicillin-binding protein 2